jgi:hypothetical protein
LKEDFLKYQAQTTPHPLALEISHAKGSYIHTTDGKNIWILLQGFPLQALDIVIPGL